MITGAIVTGELSMGEGAVIKGGKLPVTLDGEVAVGADAQLVGAVHICDEVEVGESAQSEGPRGGRSDEVATELAAGCEILDRARLHPGARLGAQTVVGSSAEVGTQVVTGASTDIGDHASVGDFSQINGSMICDQARVGHGVETDRKSTRLNSSHVANSYAVFCLNTNNSRYNRAT